jgi:uncharacterized protein YjiS (DUF1127 family)
MTARTVTARHTSGRTGFLARLSDLLILRSSRARLATLDDHMLRDVGITREQARSELDRPLWDAPAGWRR